MNKWVIDHKESYIDLKRIKRNPFFISACLIFVFFWMLHPASGFLGGFLFILLGWIIPDAVNLCLSYGVAKMFGGKSFIRKIVIFIFVSLSLVIIPNFRGLMTYINSDVVSGYEIVKRIESNNELVSLHTSAFAYKIFPHFLIPSHTVGGDEGCGCMYFTKNNDYRLWEYFHLNIRQTLNKKMSYRLYPTKDEDGYFHVYTSQDKHDRYFDFYLKVMEGGEVVGTFWQKGLPISIIKEEVFSREDGLEKDFWKNSIELLLRNTFFAQFFTDYLGLSYFPTRKFNQFLKEVITVKNVPDY